MKTPLETVQALFKPLRNLYRNTGAKPGAIAVTPEQFDALCDVVYDHSEFVNAYDA